jgi:hypothetical protein
VYVALPGNTKIIESQESRCSSRRCSSRSNSDHCRTGDFDYKEMDDQSAIQGAETKPAQFIISAVHAVRELARAFRLLPGLQPTAHKSRQPQ